RHFFSFILRHPPETPLFPYTTLFRSVHNRVRGLQPWPGAFTTFRGHILHVWRSRIRPGAHPQAARIFSLRPLVVSTADGALELLDRKSTRLNSSHLGISYAVFCLKKK